MSELDVLTIENPLKEDFGWRFNGEQKEILANEIKQFPRDIGLHMAKHLSDKILSEENPARVTDKMSEREKEREHMRIAQLMVYDNPSRRIALYRILKDPILVQECVMSYNLKGFMGDMDVYKQHVIKDKGEFRDKPKEKETPIDVLTREVKELREKLEKTAKVEKVT